MTVAELERDKALDRVRGHNPRWTAGALAVIRQLPIGWVGTGEDVRHAVNRAMVGQPSSPNAWGALIKAAINLKLLTHTGRWLKMKDKGSHARMTPEYRR